MSYCTIKARLQSKTTLDTIRIQTFYLSKNHPTFNKNPTIIQLEACQILSKVSATLTLVYISFFSFFEAEVKGQKKKLRLSFVFLHFSVVHTHNLVATTMLLQSAQRCHIRALFCSWFWFKPRSPPAD